MTWPPSVGTCARRDALKKATLNRASEQRNSVGECKRPKRQRNRNQKQMRARPAGARGRRKAKGGTETKNPASPLGAGGLTMLFFPLPRAPLPLRGRV
eukprot:9488073-Pyramimonas_sp.AAC.2